MNDLALPKIALVLKGYPRLSETFIAQEILELERAGFQGTVLPVVGELPPIQHQIARKLDAAFAAV